MKKNGLELYDETPLSGHGGMGAYSDVARALLAWEKRRGLRDAEGHLTLKAFGGDHEVEVEHEGADV